MGELGAVRPANAFAHDWSCERGWAFPPPRLVGDVAALGEDVRRVARYLNITDLDLSAKSLRIGGLSAATEDEDGPGMEVVSAEMRWRSKKVPQNVYKRKTAEEQRRTGLALHAAVRARSSRVQTEQVPDTLQHWLN